MSAPKLVLCVIDALKPAALERAVQLGHAPTLRTLMSEGTYIDASVAAFPSVTPVCAASIVTGTAQDAHLIPAMNWYHRAEERYVEYGSSLRAAQRFGIARQLLDTVYNMNRSHLAAETPTVFERLDDAGVRTAGTTYLMYRGRHVHEPQRDTALTRIAAAALMRHPVLGPRELFYADIFASRRTGCRSQLGMPGIRDRHSGCVGAHLVEHDLFDFLLLSLPDNDWYSHKHGPDAQIESIAEADHQLHRVMEPAGGVRQFLQTHAVIVCSDHSHALVERSLSLQSELKDLDVLSPGGANAEQARVAVCPSQRSALLYALGDDRDRTVVRLVERSLALDGIDLAMWRAGGGEGAIANARRGELRFAPGGDLQDPRGERWSVEGDLEVIGARIEDGRIETPHYPDALARAWAALTCPTSGDVALSCTPGWEFEDWGRQAHVGGGSHGSLHCSDSLGALIMAGTGPPADAHRQWAIRDVAPIILSHYDVA